MLIYDYTLDIAPENYYELSAYYALFFINIIVLIMIIRSIYLINKHCNKIKKMKL